MKSIDTLIQDIDDLFGKGAILDGANLLDFSKALAENTARRFQEYSEERKPYLRLSNVGKPLRQLWFEIRGGPGEPLTAQTKLKFLYGDILEDLAILLAREAGHDVKDLQKEVSVDGVLGSIDCVVDGYLLDVKSCSSRSYQKFKTNGLFTDDPFGYIGQLSGYATALGTDTCAFWAIDKQLGHMCLMKLTKEEIEKYNVREEIRIRKEVLRELQPPEGYCYPDKPDGVTKTAPFGNGNRILGVGCSYCSHKFKCRPGLKTYIYSTGPKYFTHIEPNKEPKVFQKL